MKINLYNHYHNGDVFFSRGLVATLRNADREIAYYTKSHPSLLTDLGAEVRSLEDLPASVTKEALSHTLDSGLYINTWIGCENFRHFYNHHRPGSSIYTHTSLWSQICRFLCVTPILPNRPILLTDFPTTTRYNEFAGAILVCNGPVMSGQSENFDFNQYVNRLVATGRKIIFTDDSNRVPGDTIYYSRDFLEEYTLAEHSKLSEVCDIIIGRNSGPFCTAQTRRNLTNPNKTFISIVNNTQDGFFVLPGELPGIEAKIKLFTPDQVEQALTF